MKKNNKKILEIIEDINSLIYKLEIQEDEDVNYFIEYTHNSLEEIVKIILMDENYM